MLMGDINSVVTVPAF